MGFAIRAPFEFMLYPMALVMSGLWCFSLFLFWENSVGYDGGVFHIWFVVLESFLCGFYGM